MSVTQSRPMNSSKLVKWGEIMTFFEWSKPPSKEKKKKSTGRLA